MGSQDGEETWTFVTNKRNRQSGKRAPTLAPTTVPASPQTRTTPNLSVEEIRSDHRKFVQQWVDSNCCNELKDIAQAKSCHPSPTKAVCLGLGSFDPEDGSWQIRRRSHVQLAAFMTFVECVEQLCGRKVRRIFQEPCFTVGDKEFLTSLGHEIVDSPKGFEEISEDSIVFGIHLYRNIYSAAIEKALPAIFIGTGYDVWERYADSKDPSWARMRQLHDSCHTLPFPDDKDFYPTFTSTTIHWLRPNQDPSDEISNVIGSLSLEGSES